MADDLVQLFTKIGLSEKKAKETVSNKKLAPTLKSVIDHANVTSSSNDIPKPIGNLLYVLASTVTKNATPHLEFLTKEILAEKLKSSDQVSAAIKFFESVRVGQDYDLKSYEESCGIGIEISEQELISAVADIIKRNKDRLEKDRYRSLGFLLGECRATRLRWANSLAVKEEVEKNMTKVLGPKDERDDPKAAKKKEKAQKAKKDEKVADVKSGGAPDVTKLLTNMFFEGEMARLHKPGENPQLKPELMEEHLRATGGKYVTRFPPEPNGYLHIGHAKAININFGYAQVHNGICYLRYDDTNPEAEEERFFNSIEESVRWLGFKPFKITYSSDYFQRLYELAVELIRRDKAYVCHCTGEEIYLQRGGAEKGPRTESPWRNRPIKESLAEFEKMKQGRYKEGEAILRMKMDMQSGNPQFWDLIAYRVLYTPHHRTGDQWCIYPTYDFTHCLVDSFENITHSLCTTEFRQARESYYWLVDALEVYRPVQWEYGRLSITNTVLSKRKLTKLVETGAVSSWDDPRLYTLVALRRRGFPPQAINAFVREVGVTTNVTTIDVARLENHVRAFLNEIAPRLMAILDPVKITIDNLPEAHHELITLPNNPVDATAGSRQVPFTRTLYIDRDDFREVDSKDYYRLAPGKSVGLLGVSSPITCIDFKKDPQTGLVTEIKCKIENDPNYPPKKPKTYIHWIADSPTHRSPVKFEARIYESLFLHSNPQDKNQVPGGWLSDVNPNSLKMHPDAIMEIGILDWIKKHKADLKRKNIEYVSTAKRLRDADEVGKSVHRDATDLEMKSVESLKFQFTRTGYFSLDPESEIYGDDPQDWKLIMNKVVSLKEDSGKAGGK
ncbi:tRNA synthetases class I, catalytic domain-containing protein [Paraphysoderma sedebokerense]|nr:tRNA synthetases class I, catalytic domain-containing protein [Paraphysoderma sedebokerense]